jgi:hypothetical protein
MADRPTTQLLKPKAASRPVADPQAVRKQIDEFRRTQSQVIQDSITELQANREEIERQARMALEEIAHQIGEFEKLMGDLDGHGGGAAHTNGGATKDMTAEEQLKADARRIVQELRASGSWISRSELAKLVRDGNVEAALATFSSDDFEKRGTPGSSNVEYRWVGL